MTAALGRVDVTLVRTQVLDDLGPPTGWERPGLHCDSLSLAVVDAVCCAAPPPDDHGADGYRRWRLAEHADPDTEGVRTLLATYAGGPEAWAHRVGVRPETAAAVELAAVVLLERGIDSATELRAALLADEAPLKTAWCHVPGQRGGASWSYLLTLVGLPTAVPDRPVVGYLSRATGRELTAPEAAALLPLVAAELGVEAYLLDHNLRLRPPAPAVPPAPPPASPSGG